MSNIVFEKAQERVVKSYKMSFKELFLSSKFFSFSTYLLLLIGVFITLYTILYTNNYTLFHKYYIYFSASFALLTVFALLLSSELDENTSGLVENKSKKKYLISLGHHIVKFYGDAKKSNFKDNLVKPLLLSCEKVKRHIMIVATIGAGKTVLMKGIAEQQIALGGGTLIVDGKGTTEFAKEMYALCLSLGREKDFIHLNFLDLNNTHSINPLCSGDVNTIYEILISLLSGEEDEWKAKQKEFMKTILKLLIFKRDVEKQELNFKILSEYLTLDKLIDEAIFYRHLARENRHIADFVLFVSSSIGINYNEFLSSKIEIDLKVDRKIYPKGKLIVNEFVKKAYDTLNSRSQGVYDVTVSAAAWRSIMTTLGSDYHTVFNQKTPDISLWEVIQHNKILFVTLPTMNSDTTPKELGKLILGLLKGVAAQKAALTNEPEIPFIAMFDEIGSYIINGFGRLMSKSRSLGISIIPIFQSFSQIDAVDGGKGLETKEMLDVTGTLVIMKTTSPEVTEQINRKLKQKKFIDKSYQASSPNETGEKINVEKEEAIKHSVIEKMNNGEMVVITDGEMYLSIANAENSMLNKGKKTIYKLKDLDAKIPLTQYVNKDNFFKQMQAKKILWEKS